MNYVGFLTDALAGLFHLRHMIFNNMLIMLVLITFTNQALGMDKEQFFVQSDEFFHSNVEGGLVKYSQIRQDADKIQALVNYVNNADISSFDDAEKLAFYLNAYNLLVINQIIAKYPVDSPMSIQGFFDNNKHSIAGEKLTLNDLENKKVRTYKDPRIHFALVCAALGCPKIGDFGYRPEKLEEQLTQQAKLALNDPDFIIVDGNKVKISEIFKWYRQDFGKSDKDLINFINKYRKNPLPEKSKLSYYSYNWTLNESK